MSGLTEEENRAFAVAFRSFLEWVHSNAFDDRHRNEVVAVIQDFLGEAGQQHSVMSRPLPVFEHVNLQTALDSWITETGRSVVVHGIAIPPHHGSVNLQQLVSGEASPPLRLSAPPLVDLPNGPTSTLACYLLAVLLVTDALGSYAVLVSGPSEHEPGLSIEVAGLPVDAAQAVLARLEQLRSQLNVYRGQLLDIGINPMGGGMVVSFGAVPPTTREDVVLPDVVLERIERHAIGVSAHREALLAAKQHLKRGVLLFGPPAPARRTPPATCSASCTATPASF